MIKHIEIPINEIILLDENPRTISDVDLVKLAEDIKKDPTFLYQRPPLINLKDGQYLCYAGTQRVKASRLNGTQTISCFVEENVPEKVQKERMVRDNLHRGKWDRDKLLDLDFNDFELEDFGFNDIGINLFDEDLEYPKELTAPKKENPPTMKITFGSTNDMERFQKALPVWLEENHFEGITYSVSQGEI